jgi:hypothetical protein
VDVRNERSRQPLTGNSNPVNECLLHELGIDGLFSDFATRGGRAGDVEAEERPGFARCPVRDNGY